MNLYEDDRIIATVPANMLGKGHITVATKEKSGNIQEMTEKDFQHLIYGASFAATALFENMEAHGTNIILNTGNALKKEDRELTVNVLARWGNDNLNLLWKPKQMSQQELSEVADKIKNKADMIGVPKKEKEVFDMDKKPESLEPEKPKDDKKENTGKQAEKTEEKQEKKDSKEEPEDENYLIKQLRRLP